MAVTDIPKTETTFPHLEEKSEQPCPKNSIDRVTHYGLYNANTSNLNSISHHI